MAVQEPPILWFVADPRNTRARPAGIVYEAIVIHTTAGGRDIETLGRWFGGENIRQGMTGSTHFGVDQQGRIGQFVNLANMAIAHGDETGATARLARENSVTANAWAIGIEHLDGGVPGSVTAAQLEASAWLCAWLWETQIAPHAATTGAVLDREHLLGHYELAPVSRPICPSWPEARFLEQIARIRARLQPVQPQPSPVTTLADEVAQWLRDDAAGAAMRAARLEQLRGGA
jgi:hypothetical protein